MFDFADTRHLHIEFRLEAVKNEGRSRLEGRPIYQDQELVVIKFVGDRKKELVAPAREKFARDRKAGQWITYADAFPRHYEAFRSGRDAPLDGTPLSECGFLTPAQVKEFASLDLRTVEQLADLEGAGLQRLGLHGRDHKNQALRYLENAREKTRDRRLEEENADLRRRLEALEKAQTTPALPLVDVTSASNAELKAIIKEETGHKPTGPMKRKSLQLMALGTLLFPKQQPAEEKD